MRAHEKINEYRRKLGERTVLKAASKTNISLDITTFQMGSQNVKKCLSAFNQPLAREVKPWAHCIQLEPFAWAGTTQTALL